MRKKQNKFCCFQNVFNFLATCWLRGFFVFFDSFQFVFKFSILIAKRNIWHDAQSIQREHRIVQRYTGEARRLFESLRVFLLLGRVPGKTEQKF